LLRVRLERAGWTALLAAAFLSSPGCSGSDPTPTEEGAKADLKFIEDSASANQAAAKAASRPARKSNVGVMPP